MMITMTITATVVFSVAIGIMLATIARALQYMMKIACQIYVQEVSLQSRTHSHHSLSRGRRSQAPKSP